MLERFQKLLFLNYWLTYLPLSVILYTVLTVLVVLDATCDGLKEGLKEAIHNLDLFTRKHYETERPFIYKGDTK